MSHLTTLEDIGLLPKEIKYGDETFMFNTWITFKGKLCIGYKHISTRDSIISILVGNSISYGTYLIPIKVNEKEINIESIIAEVSTPEEAFNKLYDIVTRGLYKFK